MNISHVLYDGICVGLFHASEQTHCAPVVHDPFGNERLLLLYTPCFEEPLKWLQCCLVVTWLVPHETAAVLAQDLHTQTVRQGGSSFMWHQPCNNQTAPVSYTHLTLPTIVGV